MCDVLYCVGVMSVYVGGRVGEYGWELVGESLGLGLGDKILAPNLLFLPSRTVILFS